VLAINYLDGLETIHRQGYIRDLVIRRLDSLDGRGEIDVEQTLLNHARGTLEPHWIRNETEYDNAANSLLHFAGKTLLRLFRQKSHERTTTPCVRPHLLGSSPRGGTPGEYGCR